MNKEEFQQTIKNMKPQKTFISITLREAYEAGFEEAKGNALCNSYFLNEPEKPVVPTYIDRWIQGCKYNGFDLLEAITMSIDMSEGKWINDNPETFAKAWLYDYEVEKEKLYTVELPIHNGPLGFHYVLSKNKEGEIILGSFYNNNWKKYDYCQLTEAEIKQDFEWAWRFAKEV